MNFTSARLLDRITQPGFDFSLRGWKAPATGFFASSPARGEILAERRRWLSQDPERHRVFKPAAVELVQETVNLASSLDPAFNPPAASISDQLNSLGEHWECDFILCSPGSNGRMCMQAGVVCFPSYWAPEEKIGLPVSRVHSLVPGLNHAIGEKIDHLLERLPHGDAWLRVNWGLSASAERNQHPRRGTPRLNSATPTESIWLRLEYQALLRLPVTQGILFGIQLHNFSLADLRANSVAARAVAGQLRSMPLEMQQYKGIQDVAPRVADWLA